MKSGLEQTFIWLIKDSKLPMPISEYKFCPNRRWRFDFAWINEKIAVEIEGGIWIQGRHNRGTGFLKDLEKYNNAVLNGWKILRYANNNLTQAILDLKQILK